MATDPIQLFLECRKRAVAAGTGFEGTKAVLATATPDGRPSARYVLVKDVGPEGFFVYTNYGSRKAHELDANPWAALCIHWPEIGEQFRIEGRVERTDAATSDAYFHARPRESQLGAWASDQSRPIPAREHLMERLERERQKYDGRPVPRPPHWGGYLIVPTAIERWVNGDHRLHDRFLFERSDDGWKETRLAP